MKLQEVIDCLNEVVANKTMCLDDETVVCVRPDASDYANTWYQYDYDIYVAFEAGKRILVFDSNEHELLLNKIEEEANIVADYAGLPSNYTFRVEAVALRTNCILHWGEDTSEPQQALCNINWLLGNLKRCPDKATQKDLLDAIDNAHPDKIRKSKTIVDQKII